MKLTEQQTRALEALESMDDFARMDVGVDPIGPYKVLREFIESHGDFLAALPKPKPVGEFWANEEDWGMLAYEGAVIDDGAKLYPTPPQPDDVRDAERYRWLRDVGDETFIALGKRPNVQFTYQIDKAIDAAIAAAKGEV